MARASKKQRQPVGSLVVIFAVILIVIVGGVFYFSNSNDDYDERAQSGQLNNGLDVVPKSLAGPTAEGLERGDIGEIDEEGLPLPVEYMIPSSIFSTTGKIIELNKDELVAQGSGTNFADGIARRLTCAFLETTLTLARNPVKYYKGKDGIDKLQKGAEVLLMSRENIRGKTEFNLKAVKILE